jgi:hypothetical protein
MAKILLLDFEENDYRALAGKKFDVELAVTNWKTGKVESLVPARECDIVIYQVNLTDYGTGLHAGDTPNFEKIVNDGGTIVCFIGDSQEYHLTNIIGAIPLLRFEENAQPDKLYETKDSPFDLMFGQFKSFVSQAKEIFPTQNNLGKKIDLKTWDPPYEGELQVLAESFRNYPIAALLRKGKGMVILLPWFGEKNVEVAEWLLSRGLPEIAPHLYAEVDTNWLDSYDYVFPSLLDVYKQMEEENERHRKNMLQLEEKIDEIRSSEQEPFNQLLTAEGTDLAAAVVGALKYLEFVHVISVDEYWKHVIHAKEEDIWLMDEDDQSVEQLIRGSHLNLVAVRNGKAAATDDDCLLLQRFKGRRMQEFNNTRMKAILIGNYFSEIEAKQREIPFSETQIGEAAKDGNGLLTTYELFKAIKAEKENKITKDAIRNQLINKVGLITFDI